MDNTETKTVYSYDNDGNYLSAVILDKTDRSPISGRWQIPGNCTEVAPPEAAEGQKAVWDGSNWALEEIPAEELEPEIPESDEPVIMDTEQVNQETIEMAETVIELYNLIETLESRIAALEGGVENGENAL